MAYFWAFCEANIIREALQKARFSCTETYLLFGLIGEKVDSRRNVVGFRLWIRYLIRKTKRSEWIMKCFIIFYLFFEKTIALSLGQYCIINSAGGDGIGV